MYLLPSWRNRVHCHEAGMAVAYPPTPPTPWLNWNVHEPSYCGPLFLGEMPVGSLQGARSTGLGLPLSTAATLAQNRTSSAAGHPPAFTEPSCLETWKQTRQGFCLSRRGGSPGGEMCRTAGQQWVQGERGSAWEVLPQEGSWGLINQNKLTGETRQQGVPGRQR